MYTNHRTQSNAFFGGDTGDSCFLHSFSTRALLPTPLAVDGCLIAFQQSLDCVQLVIDYLTSSSFVSVKKVGQFPRQHRQMGSLARRLFYPSASSTLPARARPRLSLLQRHLDSSPFELNTPFSIERASELEIDVNHIRPPFQQQQQHVRKISSVNRQQTEQQKENPLKMSSQPPHPALMIPGPIEVDDAVLQAMSHYRLDLLQSVMQHELIIDFKRIARRHGLCQRLRRDSHHAPQALPDL